MYHITRQRLLHFTDHVEFERMVLDLLSALEYPGIDPQSPTLPDGGKDGLFYYSDESCAWFAFSLEKRWKPKYLADLDRAIASSSRITTFVFCSNQDLPTLERDKLKTSANTKHRVGVDFYDLERIRVALDTVAKDIRQNYLGITDNTTQRRLLRYILLDPDSEVPAADIWRVERVLDGGHPQESVLRWDDSLAKGDLSRKAPAAH